MMDLLSRSQPQRITFWKAERQTYATVVGAGYLTDAPICIRLEDSAAESRL